MKRYNKYERKVGWIVKGYGKCGRRISWRVKRYEKYERKVNWIAIRYGKCEKKYVELWKDMENTEET